MSRCASSGKLRVLITGGSGFVGLAVADALLAAGHDVALLADREPPARLIAALPRPAPLLLADVREADQVRAAFEHARPTHVVHAAALTPSPAQEAALAAATMTVNVGGTATVLAEAARAGLARVVLTSSVAVYGPVPTPRPSPEMGGGAGLSFLPFREGLGEGPHELEETRAPAPATLYAISKHAAEQVASRLADLHGTDLAIARLGPVFGPYEHETGARGQMSPHRQILLAARAGIPVVLPWRLAADWIFSRDVGEAILSLLTAASLPRRTFNVGAGAITDLLTFAAHRGIPARIAEPGEPPTIEHPMLAERPPMATARLAAATGWRAAHAQADAAIELRDWSNRHEPAP